MFMMNPMMYSSMMYSPMMYSAMYAPMMSANTPSYFIQKYCYGPEDFATSPFKKATPIGVMECYKSRPTIKAQTGVRAIKEGFKSYFA